MLDRAVQAIRERGYWSPFPESASPKNYGEGAAEAGMAAFDGLLGKRFPLTQPASVGQVGSEKSPFGLALGITYPKADLDALLAAAGRAQDQWRKAGPETWVGVSLEIITRLNRASFEIANAVMHTTGQAFMMAFQAGGPHAQDRALEAVAYAWEELRRVPAQALWEKPQGKNEPIRMEKHYRVVPRGVALVIGCCTFPTWNGYPGIFASLATGNVVVVKPHPGAILPLAITVGVQKLLGDPARAVEVLGAVQNDGVVRRLEAARSLGTLVLDTQTIVHPAFPGATVRTPLIVKLTAADRATYLNEWFGPIAFVIGTESTDESLAIARDAVRGHGALTLSVYSTSEDVIGEAIDVAEDAGVALSINLTGGVFVNQSAAFSDFHGTGANPAANAALTDSAYVANRFRVVQHRRHV